MSSDRGDARDCPSSVPGVFLSKSAGPVPGVCPDPGASTSTSASVDPSGVVGPETGHDQQTGRFTPGNRAALVVGERSAAFWAAQESTRRDIVEAVLQDSGHTADDAPRALCIAAEGIAQAAIVRDSAFDRMVESGGPLTSKGRGRRCLTAWLAASDRLLRHLQAVGFKRVPRAIGTIEDYRNGTYRATRAVGEDR